VLREVEDSAEELRKSSGQAAEGTRTFPAEWTEVRKSHVCLISFGQLLCSISLRHHFTPLLTPEHSCGRQAFVVFHRISSFIRKWNVRNAVCST